MTNDWALLEQRRCDIQIALDAQKSAEERNKLGQFATPTRLAREILAFGLDLLPRDEPVRFFDPAVGTGAFYAALRTELRSRPLAWARGVEIDPHYAVPARDLWAGRGLQVIQGDFTRQVPPVAEAECANLLICNPPYVRHHHLSIDEKKRLQAAVAQVSGMALSGLSGLYGYFVGLAHDRLAEGGIGAWLVPSEFMDVNYGKALKTYLLNQVTLLHIHRFDPTDVQFDDALVSSAVVWMKKDKPTGDYPVTFSYGGSLAHPAVVRQISAQALAAVEKWTGLPQNDIQAVHQGFRLGDLFSVKRGLATGDNDFFILDEKRARALGLPVQFLRPILPGSRYITGDEIGSDQEGIPLLEKRLVLLDCNLPETQIRVEYPALWAYLETGLDSVASRYLCRSRRRWYAQECRPAAPIVCTYMGRGGRAGRPFRFLLNTSQATAANTYLMLYPRPLLDECRQKDPDVMRKVWAGLNAIGDETLIGNGRVYGGGLYKLEPRELANVPVDELAAAVGIFLDALR